MENEREETPDIEEKPYITDTASSNKPRRFKFRSPALKYGGGVLGIPGFMGSLIVLLQYVWEDYKAYYVDFDPYASQLAITGSMVVVGFLLYNLVDG